MTLINTFGIKKLSFALAMLLLVAVSFSVAPKAHATDLFDSYDYFVADMGSYGGGSSYDYFVPDSSYGGSSSYDYFVPENGGSSYDYFVPDSSYGGGSTMGGGSSYGGGSTMGGGSQGGYSMPRSTMGGSGSMTQSQGQSQSSNNTNVNNNIITIGATVAQASVCPAGTTGVYPNCVYPNPVCPSGMQGIYPNCTYPQPPQYDVCTNLPGIQSVLPSGYYVQNGYCQYQNYNQPTYPTPVQPYVTLASVPYTGLEMGPVETVMYWGFLVFMCLIAAYLIAVKKIHHSMAAWFVGSTPSHNAVTYTAPAHVAHATPVASPAFDGIDPFIQSQIHRTK
jgi:hypothetical protein